MVVDPELFESMRLELRRGSLVLAVLARLRDLGVPTVPTHWSSRDLPDWPEYVVKPAISAGARDTTRTTDRDKAAELAATLEAAGRQPMVQPYLDMVESEGETSLLYFNRRLSHAVRRNPMLAPGMTFTDNARAELRAPAPDQVDDHRISRTYSHVLKMRL